MWIVEGAKTVTFGIPRCKVEHIMRIPVAGCYHCLCIPLWLEFPHDIHPSPDLNYKISPLCGQAQCRSLRRYPARINKFFSVNYLR